MNEWNNKKCVIWPTTVSNYNFDTAIVISGRNAFEWCVFLMCMSNIQKKCNMTPWDQNSEIWPPLKNLWTKLNRLSGWKRVKTFFFYFPNKKIGNLFFSVTSGCARKSKCCPNTSTFFPRWHAKEFEPLAALQLSQKIWKINIS